MEENLKFALHTMQGHFGALELFVNELAKLHPGRLEAVLAASKSIDQIASAFEIEAKEKGRDDHLALALGMREYRLSLLQSVQDD